MKSLVFIAALAASSMSVAAEPIIVEGAPLPYERVSFADLNLSGSAGVSTLKRRINGAADRLCRTSNVEEVTLRVAGKQCYQAAISDAYGQMKQVLAARSHGAAFAAAAITVRRH